MNNIVRSILTALLFTGTLLASTCLLAEDNWTSDKIELSNKHADTVVNAGKYESDDEFDAYFYRDPEGSEFEKLWMVFNISEKSNHLISSKYPLKITIGSYSDFDTKYLQESGSEFYSWTPRSVRIRLWDGTEDFPYGDMMEGIIRGKLMKLSYTSMSGNTVNYEIPMGSGSEILPNLLRIDSSIDPAKEEIKEEMSNAYYAGSSVCYDFFMSDAMTSTRQEFEDKKIIHDSCEKSLKLCRESARGDADLFKSCFNDMVDIE